MKTIFDIWLGFCSSAFWKAMFFDCGHAGMVPFAGIRPIRIQSKYISCVHDLELPRSDHQTCRIDKHDKPSRVLRHSAIADQLETKQTLAHVEFKLDLGANTCFQLHEFDELHIDHGLATFYQPLRRQMPLDRLEDRRDYRFGFVHAAKLQQRRCVRIIFTCQTLAIGAATTRLSVVGRILDGFVRPAQPLLCDVYPHCLRQTKPRSVQSFTLRLSGFDRQQQFLPRRYHLDLGKKRIAQRLGLLVGGLEVGKTRLHSRTPIRHRCSQRPSGTGRSEMGPGDKSVFS